MQYIKRDGARFWDIRRLKEAAASVSDFNRPISWSDFTIVG